MLIDSHCHLNMKEFKDDLDNVIQRAKAANVGFMQTICTKKSDFPEILAIASQYPEIYCSFGIHPHEVEQEGVISLEEMMQYTSHPKCIGIGETGLDYYYEHSPKILQRESFITHILAAHHTKLPIIIHTRNADDDMSDILASEMRKNNFTGLIHCFSSSMDLARKVLDLGLYISISGIVTFKNAHELKEIVEYVPLDRILIETDAPYLAPVPMRGKRNEPAFVQYVAESIANIKQISLNEVIDTSYNNFKNLFWKFA